MLSPKIIFLALIVFPDFSVIAFKLVTRLTKASNGPKFVVPVTSPTYYFRERQGAHITQF